jgi:hypothetical protein
VDAIMQLLAVYLKPAYFQVDDRFYQQKEGMAMGSYLSPLVSSIFILLTTGGRQHFE